MHFSPWPLAYIYNVRCYFRFGEPRTGSQRPRQAPKERLPAVPRLKVFSYNIGGMAMDAYDVFVDWLKHCGTGASLGNGPYRQCLDSERVGCIHDGGRQGQIQRG